MSQLANAGGKSGESSAGNRNSGNTVADSGTGDGTTEGDGTSEDDPIEIGLF